MQKQFDAFKQFAKTTPEFESAVRQFGGAARELSRAMSHLAPLPLPPIAPAPAPTWHDRAAALAADPTVWLLLFVCILGSLPTLAALALSIAHNIVFGVVVFTALTCALTCWVGNIAHDVWTSPDWP